MLWYHDHAMGITRFNVYAGLAGLYIVRDVEEEALHLPAGPYEIPLLLQDRNLDTTPDGSLTGHLLHKIEDNTMEFFGPFTLVNGTIWPHLPVEPHHYRLRLLNGSNARFYRLMLLDEQGQIVPNIIAQIGTDGGLLGKPVSVPQDGLLLAPAERADVIVDFRAFRGQQLTLVNTASAPFDVEWLYRPELLTQTIAYRIQKLCSFVSRPNPLRIPSSCPSPLPPPIIGLASTSSPRTSYNVMLRS